MMIRSGGRLARKVISGRCRERPIVVFDAPLPLLLRERDVEVGPKHEVVDELRAPSKEVCQRGAPLVGVESTSGQRALATNAPTTNPNMRPKGIAIPANAGKISNSRNPPAVPRLAKARTNPPMAAPRSGATTSP